MGEVKTEIENAIQKLGLSQNDIRLLNDPTAEIIFKDCLNHFVRSGDRRWWWEDFIEPSFFFEGTDKPYEILKDIIPELSKNVWWIVEDIQEPFYPVYEANPKVLGDIIGQCFAFEYYVINKEKVWLLCENHHNRLIGVGKVLKEKNIQKIS